MQVLSFDSGATTGWAYLDTVRKMLWFGEFENWQKVQELMAPPRDLPPQVDVVVAEEFRLYPAMGQRLMWSIMVASEVNGVIKFLAECYNLPLSMQSAAMAKKIKLVEKLRMKHAEDAVRHALAFLKREGLLKEPFADLIV